MKTSSGTDMEMNAPAVSRYQFWPWDPTRLGRLTVTTSFGPDPMKSSATSRSFQTHRNWKIANAASAGTLIGTIRRQKVVKWLAPSTEADSMIERGRVDM